MKRFRCRTSASLTQRACPLQIMCIASYPAIVRLANWKSRKLCMVFTLRLITRCARSSCSAFTTSASYFDLARPAALHSNIRLVNPPDLLVGLKYRPSRAEIHLAVRLDRLAHPSKQIGSVSTD
jgi:hypothetical protein